MAEVLNLFGIKHGNCSHHWVAYLYYLLQLPPQWDFKIIDGSFCFTYKNVNRLKLHPCVLYLNNLIQLSLNDSFVLDDKFMLLNKIEKKVEFPKNYEKNQYFIDQLRARPPRLNDFYNRGSSPHWDYNNLIDYASYKPL